MFHCSILNCEVRVPCGLKSCKLNIKSKASKNCLLLYPASSLTVGEVAFLFNKPIDELRETYSSAVSKVFDTYIQDKLQNAKRIGYAHLKVKRGKNPIRIIDDYFMDKETIIYSPKVWEKAIYHGVSVDDILSASLRLFKNNNLMDEFFGLAKGTSESLRGVYVE